MNPGAKRKSLGVKQAGFMLFIKHNVKLLSQIGFISNPDEEKISEFGKGTGFDCQLSFKSF